ncbi:MAG: Gldg family protein [Candidatus Pseudobacter hemicellulosilyticus]|uniref:Gldg family protein n=1 Tax=Candidatus Pseudobacter hemicellulosilyticus TaxID=3121375 RepID=A0AAJ5WQ37_9BACT|nr:MAG: Gldg family protein [Pseudobacter sp.]
MQLIFKIARTELKNLFYSPVAWFITIVFFVVCATAYTTPLSWLIDRQSMGTRNDPNFQFLGFPMTTMIFYGYGGLFTRVLQNLYLFIPLLTMSLISREMNSGTIKMLYSSPVKTSYIVLGKYLAITVFSGIFTAIVAIFVISGHFHVENIESGVLLSSLLGLFLLMSAYAAIGIFMSSLTTYQIISAIATFTLIFVLGNIGGLWQDYDFVRDLTYFLSISGRTSKMLRGLVTTKDIIYFVVIVAMFVSFTILKLKGTRESKPWYLKVVRYLGVIIVCLAIGYISSRPRFVGYFDLTSNKSNTLHPNTQELIKKLGDEPLEITLYTNLLDGSMENGLPRARNRYLDRMWENYLRFKPNISFRYVYYYDMPEKSPMLRRFPGKNIHEIAYEFGRGHKVDTVGFLPPAKIRKQFDPEEAEYNLTMMVTYKGKTKILRTYPDTDRWPDEMNVSALLKQFVTDTIPKILYATGNLERSIHKFGEREFLAHTINTKNRGALVNIGFECDTINLHSQAIPAGIAALVVADPKVDLTPAIQQKIQQYIEAGGNALFLGEPGKQHVLNPVLAHTGTQLSNGTLVQVTTHEMPHMLRPFVTLNMSRLADETNLVKIRRNNGKDTAQFLMPGSAEVVMTDSSRFSAKSLLTTFPGQVWLKAGKLVTDSAAPVFNAAEGDLQKDSYTVATALTRKVGQKEQRIVVAGDADFGSSSRGGGGEVLRACYSWLDNNQYPVYSLREQTKDRKLTISEGGVKAAEIIYVWIIPALLLTGGTVLLIRRRRK